VKKDLRRCKTEKGLGGEEGEKKFNREKKKKKQQRGCERKKKMVQVATLSLDYSRKTPKKEPTKTR